MSGNVWEWCLNKYDKPEDKGIDQSGGGRVLRGGSWNFSQDDARAASRFGYLPGARVSLVGFQVVRHSPSQDQ
jgi:formylglycine-generating enzyme required for sulfatase activity